MIEIAIAVAASLASGLVGLEIVMRSLRRCRVTKARICCGLFTIERDPLQGDEIQDDAEATNDYPDIVEDMRDALSNAARVAV
nr:hypothetical protein TetV2_00346 [Oceanusvirus sp.]